MDDLQKLKHLLHHWKEHNAEHAQIYKDWAEKVSKNEKLSQILEKLYKETMKLDSYFDNAIKLMDS